MRAGLREHLEGFFNSFLARFQRVLDFFSCLCVPYSVFFFGSGPNGVGFLGADFTTTIPLLRTNAAHDIILHHGEFF